MPTKVAGTDSPIDWAAYLTAYIAGKCTLQGQSLRKIPMKEEVQADKVGCGCELVLVFFDKWRPITRHSHRDH